MSWKTAWKRQEVPTAHVPPVKVSAGVSTMNCPDSRQTGAYGDVTRSEPRPRVSGGIPRSSSGLAAYILKNVGRPSPDHHQQRPQHQMLSPTRDAFNRQHISCHNLHKLSAGIDCNNTGNTTYERNRGTHNTSMPPAPPLLDWFQDNFNGPDNRQRNPKRCQSMSSYASSSCTLAPQAMEGVIIMSDFLIRRRASILAQRESISVSSQMFSSEDDLSVSRHEMECQNARISNLEDQLLDLRCTIKSPMNVTGGRSLSPKALNFRDGDSCGDEIRALYAKLESEKKKVETWRKACQRAYSQRENLEAARREMDEKYGRLKDKARERVCRAEAQTAEYQSLLDERTIQLEEAKAKLKQAQAAAVPKSPSIRNISFPSLSRSPSQAKPCNENKDGTAQRKRIMDLHQDVSSKLAQASFITQCLGRIADSPRTGKNADLNAILGLSPSCSSSVTESDNEADVSSPPVYGTLMDDAAIIAQMQVLKRKSDTLTKDLEKLHATAQEKVADSVAHSVNSCATQ